MDCSNSTFLTCKCESATCIDCYVKHIYDNFTTDCPKCNSHGENLWMRFNTFVVSKHNKLLLLVSALNFTTNVFTQPTDEMKEKWEKLGDLIDKCCNNDEDDQSYSDLLKEDKMAFEELFDLYDIYIPSDIAVRMINKRMSEALTCCFCENMLEDNVCKECKVQRCPTCRDFYGVEETHDCPYLNADICRDCPACNAKIFIRDNMGDIMMCEQCDSIIDVNNMTVIPVD